MANIKSAYKRIQIAERNRLRNRTYISSIKTLMKKTLISMSSINKENILIIKNLISVTYSKIDKAVQKGILHINNGSSKKSQINKHFRMYESKLRERN
nr:ribosomal protein S20 [Cryptomonas sp. NIES-345]BDA98413.1 ribosomal protein S20 [Cryptomonas sp. NIES-1327]